MKLIDIVVKSKFHGKLWQGYVLELINEQGLALLEQDKKQH